MGNDVIIYSVLADDGTGLPGQLLHLAINEDRIAFIGNPDGKSESTDIVVSRIRFAAHSNAFRFGAGVDNG